MRPLWALNFAWREPVAFTAYGISMTWRELFLLGEWKVWKKYDDQLVQSLIEQTAYDKVSLSWFLKNNAMRLVAEFASSNDPKPDNFWAIFNLAKKLWKYLEDKNKATSAFTINIPVFPFSSHSDWMFSSCHEAMLVFPTILWTFHSLPLPSVDALYIYICADDANVSVTKFYIVCFDENALSDVLNVVSFVWHNLKILGREELFLYVYLGKIYRWFLSEREISKCGKTDSILSKSPKWWSAVNQKF